MYHALTVLEGFIYHSMSVCSFSQLVGEGRGE
jgi:hypothetical protein